VFRCNVKQTSQEKDPIVEKPKNFEELRSRLQELDQKSLLELLESLSDEQLLELLQHLDDEVRSKLFMLFQDLRMILEQGHKSVEETWYGHDFNRYLNDVRQLVAIYDQLKEQLALKQLPEWVKQYKSDLNWFIHYRR